jgi:hypothetical protein
MRPPSGGHAAGTSYPGWWGSWPLPAGRDIPTGFPPLQRAQIVRLACLEPVAKGLHITHWTSKDLARQAVLDGIAEAISDRTIRRIWNEVDLQPHRTRYPMFGVARAFPRGRVPESTEFSRDFSTGSPVQPEKRSDNISHRILELLGFLP